jgi:hypothetical protein
MENEQSDNAIAGKYFLYTRPSYSVSTSYTAELDVMDSQFNLEFRGGGSSSSLWSVPGDYVIVVYGENSGNTALLTEVKFDIKVYKTMPFDIVNRALIIIAWFLILGSIGSMINNHFEFIELKKEYEHAGESEQKYTGGEM